MKYNYFINHRPVIWNSYNPDIMSSNSEALNVYESPQKWQRTSASPRSSRIFFISASPMAAKISLILSREQVHLKYTGFFSRYWTSRPPHSPTYNFFRRQSLVYKGTDRRQLVQTLLQAG
jgi:hypothetical protein